MGDWSRLEVEVIVADYFEMLALELRGEPYNKAARNRALLTRLDGRSRSAVEFKHRNISTVLIELGQPWISGYKPAANRQQLLYDVIAARIAGDRQLQLTMKHAVDRPAETPRVRDILHRLEPAPTARERMARGEESVGRRSATRIVNYLEREARNASVGRAGEDFALTFERARLLQAGKEDLADRIEHVSAVQGDGAGYDIRSFEANGRDRFIEVKTTRYGKQTPFFVSRNEVAASRELDESYHLYRVFTLEDPRLFSVRGNLNESFKLTAEIFSARVA
jgi:hypothetical protein